MKPTSEWEEKKMKRSMSAELVHQAPIVMAFGVHGCVESFSWVNAHKMSTKTYTIASKCAGHWLPMLDFSSENCFLHLFPYSARNFILCHVKFSTKTLSFR